MPLAKFFKKTGKGALKIARLPIRLRERLHDALRVRHWRQEEMDAVSAQKTHERQAQQLEKTLEEMRGFREGLNRVLAVGTHTLSARAKQFHAFWRLSEQPEIAARQLDEIIVRFTWLQNEDLRLAAQYQKRAEHLQKRIRQRNPKNGHKDRTAT